LYNPYDVDLDLTGYELHTSGVVINLETLLQSYSEPARIRARSYIVIANRQDDPLLGVDPFIPGATVADGVVLNPNLFIDTSLTIASGQSVSLARTNARIRDLDWTGTNAITEVEVDELTPVDLGASDDRWAAPGPEQTELDDWEVQPIASGDKLVRDTSLQRHKELPGETPRYWHCTLSRQMLLPLPDYEDDPDGAGPLEPPLLQTDTARPAQHNLLNTDPMANFARISNQQLVEKEFLGIPLAGYLPFPGGTYGDFPVSVDLTGGDPIAQFPIVTADRGIDSVTGGCIAFPTTGTLLW